MGLVAFWAQRVFFAPNSLVYYKGGRIADTAN